MNKILYTVVYLLLLQQVSIANTYDEMSISFKNDALFNEDQDYTAGFELSYKSADCDLTYYLGQDIYTPQDKRTTEPLSGEHPYAAWLYIGASKKIDFNEDITNNIKVTVGTIGKNAKGKSIANAAHDIIGASDENGWDTQVHKSLAYNINLKSYYNPASSQYNNYTVKPYLVANAGNILTDIGLGLRVDTNINNSLKLYASGEIKYIDKNIFLDGENKNGSTQYAVKKLDHKNTFTLGLETTYIEDYTIVAEMIFNSKEYETQVNNNNYGMLKIVKKF